jgi:hypothetical protein|tara:strand:- start:1884 stop:2261 length:378 start_codon:yes stop_codon:yes gene_type:complete
MSKYELIHYAEVVDACDEIAKWVIDSGIEFRGIWGSPRGGLVPAVILSHKLGLKLFDEPRVRPLLVVDDIADTGQTLNSLSKLDDVYIATIHYHEQSQFVPDKWVLQKKDKWIVYPWEKEYWEKQ